MRPAVVCSIVWLVGMHAAVIAARFVAPYDFARQNRSSPLAPPTRVHVFAESGLEWPFVCRWVRRDDTYREDCGIRYPLRLLTADEGSWRLFGVRAPGSIHLMGTDEYGRDQFSRFLHGGRVSLLAGFAACLISLGVALCAGAVAGYAGGWTDEAVMTATELSMSLPWLYVLFAIRAALPLDLPPHSAFLLIITLVGFIGWARPARLIRGIVLGARECEYVLAARGFGAPDTYILRVHLLPATLPVLAAQASVLVPRYVMAEVSLSFFGLGINEPGASWGRMLASIQHVHTRGAEWPALLAALGIVPTFLAYLTIARAIQARQAIRATELP